ncbi:unnamed protein product [Scytosiphon promiscuus]
MFSQRRLLVAAVLASAIAANTADACSCQIGSSLCDKFGYADVVLRGTVTARQVGEDTNDDTLYNITTTEIFKGEADEEYAVSMSVEIATGGNSGLCGIYLEVEEEHVIDLVHTTLAGEELLYTSACGLAAPWESVGEEDRALLRGGCDDYDPCEGACDEFQECLLFISGYYSGNAATEYYCSDTCDPGTCEETETCELLYTPCAGSDYQCPRIAECTGTDPVTSCSDVTCEEYQECLVYEEGTVLEEAYCADTCASGACGDEQSCSLEEVDCVRAPCPPVAVCAGIPTPAPPTESPTGSPTIPPTEPPTEPPTAGGGGGYEYVGCFKDAKADRVLDYQYDSPDMTTEVCVNHCSAEGAAYAATQYGYECWCYVRGRSDFDRHEHVPECDMPCQGDEEETCGGYWAFSLYKLDWPAAPVDDPEYVNCYRDDRSDRVMTDKVTRDDMTPAVCREHCLDKGASYYGTQYSSECWCGSSDSISDYDRHGEGVCHLECSGQEDLACGGNYAFNLFKYSEEVNP